MKQLRIFIGYDQRQPISYTALCQSIIKSAKKPVAITPLVLETLPLNRVGLTPFTYSRFLVPYLCDYQEWALFLDADIMVRADISALFDLADESFAVMVSKNKLRFEWASVMLFNCAQCKILSPEYVERADGLHGIKWADKIGDLPGEWNRLIGYDDPDPQAKLVHFTQGVPAFPEVRDCDFAGEWQERAKEAVSAISWLELMGNSVHAKPVLERLNGKMAPSPAR